MSEARRRVALYVLLAGTLGWSAWLALGDSDDTADIPELVERTAPRTPESHSPRPAGTKPLPADEPDGSVRLARAEANLFPEQTWHVPPPLPPPAPYVPPPPPQAPALPYVYMGHWLENGETTWYLVRAGTPVSVHAGQVLDGVWRLDQATAGALNFTYLPLNQTRSLRTGD